MFKRILLLSVIATLAGATAHAQETPLFEWAKHIGGTLGEQAKKMQVDGSRNIYVTGQYGGTVDFDPGAGNVSLTSAGGNDIFVCKLDENGNLIWAKSFGGINSEYVNDIEIDNAGNVHVTGYFDATVDFDPGAGTFNITPNAEDVFILKLDNNGVFVWARAVGGTNYDEGFSVETDNSGNVFVTGIFLGTADFNPGAAIFNLTSAGKADSFVLKLDINGNFAWARAFGATEEEQGRTIAIDALGDVVIAGGFYGYATPYDFDPGIATVTLTPNPTVTQWDIYVCKLSPLNGDVTWAKSISGTLWDIDRDIFIDNSDNILLTGYHQGTTDFDPGPSTFNLSADGVANAFILKLNSLGNFVWAKTIGGTGVADDRGDGIAADNVGNVYAAIAFQNTTDFDPGAGMFNIVSKGQSDMGVLKLDAAGNFIWAYGIGSTGSVGPSSIAVDNLNKIYLTGIFSKTPDFDPGACPFNMTSLGFYDTFLQKMTTGPPVLPPTITSFAPTSGSVGTSVTLTGTNFSTTPASNTVTFNITPATVTASTTTSINTTVPTGTTTGKISVTVNCFVVQSATNFTVGAAALPTITSFTPSSGPVGNSVTITGTNFSTTPVSNIVKFNGTTATVTASTTTSITTTVPSTATTGKITVTVAGNTATSATNFTVTGATGISIDQQPESVSVCEGSTSSFSLSASGAANIKYQWQKFNGTVFNNISDGGGYSGVTSTTLNINTIGNFGAGDYRCKISGDATADVFSETVNLTIGTPLVASINANGNILEASPGDTYQWFQNGDEVSGATNQSFEYGTLEYGVYTVNITDNGCTSTSAEFIYLITSNELNNHGLKIYPNPFIDNLSIELPFGKKSEIKIVDALGRSVKQYSISENTVLKLNDLSNGSYVLNINQGAQNFYFRLIKMQ